MTSGVYSDIGGDLLLRRRVNRGGCVTCLRIRRSSSFGGLDEPMFECGELIYNGMLVATGAAFNCAIWSEEVGVVSDKVERTCSRLPEVLGWRGRAVSRRAVRADMIFLDGRRRRCSPC